MNPMPNFTSRVRGGLVVAYDHSGEAGGESVRQNPQGVVAKCIYYYGNRRILVREPNGVWSELVHDGQRFLRLEQIAADELEALAERCGLDVE